MTDYTYRVRAYVDVDFYPRGGGGVMIHQNQANLPGYGTGQTPGPGGEMQTMRFQASEIVPNALTTPPTAANIGTAISNTATDIQAQITTAVLGVIQGWATGQQ